MSNRKIADTDKRNKAKQKYDIKIGVTTINNHLKQSKNKGCETLKKLHFFLFQN